MKVRPWQALPLQYQVLVFKTVQWLVKEMGAGEVTCAHRMEKAPLGMPNTSRASEELSSWREDKTTSQASNQTQGGKKSLLIFKSTYVLWNS